MGSDYASIRHENERRYGTDIGRIGQMLLAERYDNRSHFIFELLQNAEDALARRDGWGGSRAVTFDLSSTSLKFSHCGKPFDDRDVRSICGIGQSTKNSAAIGRFGIGFKSVYAFTSRPEIHSGDDSFAIESFVWPIAALPIGRRQDETAILLPLASGDKQAQVEIGIGLQQLGAGTLLFLHQIEEIVWSVEGSASGVYLRGKPEEIAPGVDRITVMGQVTGKAEIEENWLVFSQNVPNGECSIGGQVQIAFSIHQTEKAGRWTIKPR